MQLVRGIARLDRPSQHGVLHRGGRTRVGSVGRQLATQGTPILPGCTLRGVT